MSDNRLEWSFTFAPERTPTDPVTDDITFPKARETVNAIIGRWLVGKIQRAIRDTPDGDGPTRGHWCYGPHGRAALNLKKQGAGLGICRLTLFGRM